MGRFSVSVGVEKGRVMNPVLDGTLCMPIMLYYNIT